MSTSIRWTKYDGERIEAAGYRTFIERGPTIRFGNTTRIYGYVWPKGDRFCAYYETEGRGETVDVELGTFDSQPDARRAVEKALGLR